MKVITAEKNKPHIIDKIITTLIVNMLAVPSHKLGITLRYMKKYIKTNITAE